MGFYGYIWKFIPNLAGSQDAEFEKLINFS